MQENIQEENNLKPELENALEAVYNPLAKEKEIYKKWQDNNIGNPEIQELGQNKNHKTSSTFSSLMPPPNLTGELHAGHAFQRYLIDTIIRKNRLESTKSLWYPGLDHAGLQLEGVIDKLINKGEFDKRIEEFTTKFNNHSFQEIEQSLKNTDRSGLANELKNKFPELWLELAWSKVNLWRGRIAIQSEVFGVTPDYTRELFTLDKKANKMVDYAFKQYWKDELIYKSQYLVNWSIDLQTALSDVSGDTERVTRKDPFISFNYKYSRYTSKNNLSYDITKIIQFFTENPLEVATVRPETVPGDIGVAINPIVLTKRMLDFGIDQNTINVFIEDLHTHDLELIFGIPAIEVNNCKLIISDLVDPTFGTGVMKITPGSDLTDYHIWNSHFPNTPFPSVIDKLGRLTDHCGNYKGQTREEARLNLIYDLSKNGSVPTKGFSDEVIKPFTYTNYNQSLEELKIILINYKIDFEYEHNVVICERSKGVVEPLISEETFVAMKTKSTSTGMSLQEHGLDGFKDLNCYSSEYKQRGYTFIEGINDWCISRNLVWGHQFPIWYNLATNPEKRFYTYSDLQENPEHQLKFFVGAEDEFREFLINSKQNGSSWIRDNKRLDTWFSSSLWPLTTFGYLDYVNGNQSSDFANYYPTTVMATAKEIFNIWICRMIMLSKYFTSKLPKDDPKYSTLPFKDLVIHPTVLDDQGRKMSKSIGNGLDPVKQIEKYSSDALRMAMLSGMIPDRNMRLGGGLADQLCEKYRNFGNKVWNIVRFLQSKKAFGLELTKDTELNSSSYWLIKKYQETNRIYQEGFNNYHLLNSLEALYNFVYDDLASWHLEYLKINQEDLALTAYITKDLLFLLSPFMPYETELLYDNLRGQSIAKSLRDTTVLDHLFSQTHFQKNNINNFDKLTKTIQSLRSIKGLFGIPAGDKLQYATVDHFIKDNRAFITMTTKSELAEDKIDNSNWYTLDQYSKADILSLIIDIEKEKTRTIKAIEQVTKIIKGTTTLLNNQEFLNKGTEKSINKKHQDLRDNQKELETLEAKLLILQKIKA